MNPFIRPFWGHARMRICFYISYVRVYEYMSRILNHRFITFRFITFIYHILAGMGFRKKCAQMSENPFLEQISVFSKTRILKVWYNCFTPIHKKILIKYGFSPKHVFLIFEKKCFYPIQFFSYFWKLWTMF